jgi:predicted ATPase
MSLPETRERAAQELTLRLALGPVLMTAQGMASSSTEQQYTRARMLCAQLGDSPQRFPVLWGLWMSQMTQGALRTGQVLAEECLQLAEQTLDPGLLCEAHFAVGMNFLTRGEFIRGREALEQSVALYQPQHHALTPLYGNLNPQMFSLLQMSWALWHLGYPAQALTRVHEALRFAQELSHAYNIVLALGWTAELHLDCGEGQVAQEWAEATVAQASEHGFSQFTAWGTAIRGAALVMQEQRAEGIAEIRQGWEALPGETMKTEYLTWAAVGYGGAGQVDEGLATIAEVLRLVEKNDERYYEAEVWRIKGTLTLQSKTSLGQVEDKSQTSRSPSEVEEEAEECFLKAIAIAQHQQAKSLELRAVMSLARLWQHQGKAADARDLLAPVYNWFTEGFDTKDLQEAKTLLAELA